MKVKNIISFIISILTILIGIPLTYIFFVTFTFVFGLTNNLNGIFSSLFSISIYLYIFALVLLFLSLFFQFKNVKASAILKIISFIFSTFLIITVSAKLISIGGSFDASSILFVLPSILILISFLLICKNKNSN